MREVNSEELENILKEKKLVFVDFWGEACRPCEAIVPILDRISSNPEFHDYEFLSLNVTASPEVGVEYGIFSVPTLIIFVNGEERDRKTGFVPQVELEKFLHKWKREVI